MAVLEYQLPNIDQAATYHVPLLWTDEAGAPVVLTNYSARMVIRESLDVDSIPLYTLNSSGMSPTITLGGIAGTIDLKIPATVTAGFRWAIGYYTLLLKSPTGDVTTLLRGSVEVNPSTTIL